MLKKIVLFILAFIFITGVGLLVFIQINKGYAVQNEKTFDIGKNTPIDFSYYVGEWISSDTPYNESLVEIGGSILKITDINNSYIQGSYKEIKNDQEQQALNIEFKSRLVNSQSDFEYIDNRSNKGKAHLVFDGERIQLTLSPATDNHAESNISYSRELFERARIHASTETLTNVIGYFDLNTDEILKKVGDDGTGLYKFYSLAAEDIKIYITNVVEWIECGPKVDINGVHAGMNFAEIQEKLGKTKVDYTWLKSPKNLNYEISYLIDNCRVCFQSPQKDGTGSSVLIVREPLLKDTEYPLIILRPINESKKRPDFNVFYQQLLIAAKRKDLQFIIRHLDKKIASNVEPGSGLIPEIGIKAFLKYWGLDKNYKAASFWGILEDQLKLGGSFDEKGRFVAPYTVTHFPKDLDDIYAYEVTIDKNVNIYLKPDLRSIVIGKLNYDVVKTGEYNSLRTNNGIQFKDWTPVIKNNGIKGYVLNKYLRDSIDYLIYFERKNNEWKITGFYMIGD